MDLPSAGQLATSLMREHGLMEAGWGFGFNRGRRTLGLCRFGRKRIELSSHFVMANGEAEVRQTVLHEIAHALVGPPGAGRRCERFGGAANDRPHGPAWQAACRSLGIEPSRLNRTAAVTAGRWRATCGGCGVEHSRHRRPMAGRTYVCRRCGPGVGALGFRRVGAG